MATLNEELNFWLGVTHKLFIVKFMYLLKNKHKKKEEKFTHLHTEQRKICRFFVLVLHFFEYAFII